MRRALSRRLEKVEAVTRTKSSNAERLWFGLPPRVILAALGSELRGQMKAAVAAIKDQQGDPIAHKRVISELISEGYRRYCAEHDMDCVIDS